MITKKIKGKEYTMRNLLSEITLLETSKIAQIMADEKEDFSDKWLKVIEMLGGRELVNVATAKVFVELVSAIEMNNVKYELQDTIEVNNRLYKCEITDGEVELSARDLAKIENIARKGGAWLHEAYAVVYKDVMLTDNEHYDSAHLKHKAEIFGNAITAEQCSSMIFQINKQIVDNVQSLINAQSTPVS